MTEVIMPKMGDGMEEGTLLEWLKQDGDAVKSGEVIGTIQTDKATLELESPASGTLKGLRIVAGETVPVGQAIALILKEGEEVPESWSSGGSAASSAPAEQKSQPKSDASPAVPAQAEDSSVGKRVKASPLARKIAAEYNIDLAVIEGSGPGGRIVVEDVRAAIDRGVPSLAIPGTGDALTTPLGDFKPGEDRTVDLNRLRQITADRTTKSKQEVPHFYVTVEVDIDALTNLREQFKAQDAGRVSVNDFIIRACALALMEMPVVNSTYQGKQILQHGTASIGMAVALDDGLTVPVIHHAQTLTLRQISERSRELAERARSNRLSMEELSGSTFSISNMGMLDVENFAAIINTPNAGILAIGSAKKQVVVNEEDELEIRTRMKITGSFDHRVVDGAVGAKFVNLVRQYLENPTRLLS